MQHLAVNIVAIVDQANDVRQSNGLIQVVDSMLCKC